MDVNTNFGLEGIAVEVAETDEQRMERLTAIAMKMAKAESDDEIVARLVAEERAKRIAAALPVDTTGFPEDYDKIVIFKGQQKFDLSYVPLGIGGFVIKAPRGEEIIIPACFTEILDHAIEEITIQSQGGLITRPAHRFPYQKLGKSTTSEYKAYQTQQREKANKQVAQAAA